MTSTAQPGWADRDLYLAGGGSPPRLRACGDTGHRQLGDRTSRSGAPGGMGGGR